MGMGVCVHVCEFVYFFFKLFFVSHFSSLFLTWLIKCLLSIISLKFQEKGEVNGAAANTDLSSYQPRPTSEHESSVSNALYRSANDQTGTTQAGTLDSSTSVSHLDSSASMVPPVTNRLSGSTTVVGSGAVHPTLGTGRPAVDP